MNSILKTALFFYCLIWLPSCSYLTEAKPSTDILIINNLFQEDLDAFLLKAESLKSITTQTAISDKIIKEEFKKLRFAYKKLEAILSYTKAINVSTYINGAPLTKVERFNPKVVIKEPEGLQVMDELMVEDKIDRTKLLALNNLLIPKIKKEIKFFSTTNINEYHFYESLRQQIVRIGSMGITGFDTPGTLNGLAESKVSLINIKKYIQFSSRQKDLINTLDKSIQYLDKNKHFNTFNRVLFFKNYLNPLLKSITKIKNTYNEKAFSKFQPPSALSKKSQNIFDKEILDPSYFSRVPMDPEKSSLGQVLFFDPILSDKNSFSCASCHDPKKAFTDGKIKSVQGHGDNKITRNAPGLINAVFASAYFLDHRTNTLQKQIEEVIENNLEFNSDYTKIIEKLNASPFYKKMFKDIYGQEAKITVYGISHALVHYLNSLYSFNSDFDKYMRNEISTLPAAAINGFNLFMGKAACGTCHFAPTFAGLLPPNFIESETEVLGVPNSKEKTEAQIDPDPGRMKNGILKDGVPFQNHAFKTLTVRNVSLTGPYMHNGVYSTLEELMEFYNNGGGAGLGIDLEYQTLSKDSLHLSTQEISDIISFMNTLEDSTFNNHTGILDY